MIGESINGYEVTEFLGKGNFGSVYKCFSENKVFALKLFNVDYIFNEYTKNGDNNRILREIKTLSRINHKNVVKYVDDGTFNYNSQQYIFLVMEYLEGETLEEYIEKKEIGYEKINEIFTGIFSGVNALHKNNIIHRDLKPANIFLTNSGEVKILDFGLTKLIDYTSITNTGEIMGSPIFMSPEQIKDSKNLDYRSDYYSLGVILFYFISKKYPYININSIHELYYKIVNEPVISLTYYLPTLPKHIDNLVNNLLEKENYKRPNNCEEIKRILRERKKDYIFQTKNLDFFEPNFFLRTYNEKSVLERFYKNGHSIENVIFPINHRERQKNLFKLIKNKNIKYMIDPSTMRLAYNTYSNVVGLKSLPYAPTDLSVLEIEDFENSDFRNEYIKKVIEEQVKEGANYIISPFHYSNNSNLSTIKNDVKMNWFLLDVKLLKEAKDFLEEKGIKKNLVAGFAINVEILTKKTEKEYFLNVVSQLPCDNFIIYVDCISYDSNSVQLYNYMSTLLNLQNSSKKGVIAGRVGSIGLVLLAFGIYGFESGVSKFESFYEGLYKEETPPYNMYVSYYIPGLMKNISILRKDPSKLQGILEENENLRCECPYCKGKGLTELLTDQNTKLHFLYVRGKEIQELKNMKVHDRIAYIEKRIEDAIGNYKLASPVFKTKDYSFLSNWKEAIKQLKREFKIDAGERLSKADK